MFYCIEEKYNIAETFLEKDGPDANKLLNCGYTSNSAARPY